MPVKVFNYYGEDITEKPKILLDPGFGTGEMKEIELPDGTTMMEPVINWSLREPFADRDGFDTRPGADYRTEVILPKGTILCRFGFPRGKYATPEGTPYELLGLPYRIESIEYHVYAVTADIRVEMGLVAPIFGSPGGAVQYYFPDTISYYLEAGCMIERKDEQIYGSRVNEGAENP